MVNKILLDSASDADSSLQITNPIRPRLLAKNEALKRNKRKFDAQNGDSESSHSRLLLLKTPK